jgi:pimeloyl-ACP methyl ester carboxylesterase
VASIVDSVKGPVVLVGHSYGGSVISNVNRNGHVKALVYLSAFALDQGESSGAMSGGFPGCTLDRALAPPVSLTDGAKDLYIKQEEFAAQFAADVPAKEARLAAATQRPLAEAALAEPSGAPAWKSVPSWHIYGDADKNIPPRRWRLWRSVQTQRRPSCSKALPRCPCCLSLRPSLPSSSTQQLAAGREQLFLSVAITVGSPHASRFMRVSVAA